MHKNNNNPDIRALLRDEPERVRAMVRESGRWRFDASRAPLTLGGWRARYRSGAERPLEQAVRALFAGAVVNPSEHQPALHMALRADKPEDLTGRADAALVRASRERLLETAGALHAGRSPVRTLLHVGIGGSDLGPRLVADALVNGVANGVANPGSAVRVEWLTTLDARRIGHLLDSLDPAATGLVVASKSFTTVETLTQAAHIREWMGADWAERAWAATARPERAGEFGLESNHVLAFPGWTGGRFSLWSGVGLSAAAAIGPERWNALLAGARDADRAVIDHLDRSLALALAHVIDVLVRECGANTLGVVSYEPRLRLLAEYLQQLIMESLGKSVDLDGQAVAGPTAPLVFGGAGTDLQHSLFQALHQGTTRHPMLLVGSARDSAGIESWQREQLAHLLGQASVLVQGVEAESGERSLPGNNPVMPLLCRELDAPALGELLATLEHAVYLLGVLWRINPFDQWGVEEGKRLAGQFRQALAEGGESPDATLSETMRWLRGEHRGE
ncbi:MAG: hypothetical protein RQ847_01275 [Wenzhouxiangellaceae bacterium]|nr:hypothetical protein [Wenzhouxiangellaceae bacterium]